MYPERDEKRRKTRAPALQKQYGEDHGVVYVDAAAYASGSRMAPPEKSSPLHRPRSACSLCAIFSSATGTNGETAPYPILLNAQYQDQFPCSCKLCGEPGDFLHILLTCPAFPHPPSPAVVVSYRESTMNSTSAFDQRKVIS
ncbi:hypothetical protein HPB50_008021 [Hyalomma asiaticum]|uniref:Uncharacterized protein n=1 Tax=Hyalomma asiaticum TaxID=266040 RepID=A0ACB7SDE7_HYAAI|nr:hypothetical protein HPB50_008021 [Hyalomma asiaticum]